MEGLVGERGNSEGYIWKFIERRCDSGEVG